MVRTPFTRHLLGATIAAAFLSWGGSAVALDIALNQAGIQRSASARPTAQEPNWISRADCLADDVLSFPLTINDWGENHVEAWVGFAGSSACDTREDRLETPSCWKVYTGAPTSTGHEVLLHARDIISGDVRDDGSLSQGSIESCDPDGVTSTPVGIEVYFLVVDGGGEFQDGVKWGTKYDLAGPTPPTNPSSGVGDTLIVLDWDQSSNTDQTGYRFYCDPIPGKEAEQTNVTPLGDASTGITFKAGDADVDADLDASGDADFDANGDADLDANGDADLDANGDADLDANVNAETGTDAGETGTDAGTTNSACPTTILVAGQEPDEAYYCGSGSGTSGKITGLKNGVRYSVAVAGVDVVGNVGKLSSVTCAIPSPVDDFFKVYRDAGGQAGGGFCTTSGGIGHGVGASGLLLIALAALGGTLRRRRGT